MRVALKRREDWSIRPNEQPEQEYCAQESTRSCEGRLANKLILELFGISSGENHVITTTQDTLGSFHCRQSSIRTHDYKVDPAASTCHAKLTARNVTARSSINNNTKRSIKSTKALCLRVKRLREMRIQAHGYQPCTINLSKPWRKAEQNQVETWINIAYKDSNGLCPLKIARLAKSPSRAGHEDIFFNNPIPCNQMASLHSRGSQGEHTLAMIKISQF